MSTITIPKIFTPDTNLIAVPRDTYEEFLAWQKNIKSQKTFKASSAEKQALARARKNFLRGKYATLSALHHKLEHSRR